LKTTYPNALPGEFRSTTLTKIGSTGFPARHFIIAGTWTNPLTIWGKKINFTVFYEEKRNDNKISIKHLTLKVETKWN
jgi:hypothetical protein